jgi:septum formation protein
MSPPELILASGSPRRRELLAAAGYRFRVEPSPVDDDRDPDPGLTPTQIAESRAAAKARAVAERFPDGWVLGADTVVAFGGRLFGKPADRADAAAMITALAGREHVVITGVCLIAPGGREVVRSDESRVVIHPPTAGELRRFLDSGLWRGKAGGYGLQDPDGLAMELTAGSRSNVIGLPMELLAEMLSQVGR